MSTKKEKIKKVFSVCAYSAADMLGGGVGQVISLYYLSFLMFVMGLSPLLAGLVTGIGKVWDGVTDPIMGVVCDRTKTRWGSSRPWILISVPFVFLSYFMMWTPLGITGELGRFFYFVFAYMFFSTAFTVAIVPYESLLPKMVDGYQERTNYSSVRMIFSGIACVVTTYIYEWLVPVNASNPLSSAFTPNFLIMGLVLGAFFALPLVWTALGTKEKNLNYKRDDAPLTLRGVFRSYSQVLRSKLYRKYYALNLLGTFASSAISASLVIFVYLTYNNIENFFLTFSLLFLIINVKGIVEIAFFVPNTVFMKKVNKHFPYLVDIPILMAGCIILAFINSSSPIWLFMIAVCLVGAGVSCLGYVPMTLLPDLSDVDELAFGKRREGTSAGLVTLGKKIVGGLTLTLFGIVLEAFNLSTETASPAVATSSAILALKLMLCAIPIVTGAVMVIVSRTYNLNEKRHAMIKSKIAQRREQGYAEFSEEEKLICRQITGMEFETLWIATSETVDGDPAEAQTDQIRNLSAQIGEDTGEDALVNADGTPLAPELVAATTADGTPDSLQTDETDAETKSTDSINSSDTEN